jgi:GT2 family glycosyltransferase
MNISVVIPNYNGAHLMQCNLPKVIESIKSYTNGNKEIIVADDASKDDSITIINDFVQKSKNSTCPVLLVKNEKNLGFSGNVDSGVDEAKGDIIILLNSDVIPHKGFLEPLLKHFSDEKVFGVGCMDESVEDGQVVLRGRGIGKWHRGFLMHHKGDVAKTNTLWVSGGSSAFRTSVWRKLGGLNRLYNPFYWEDIDLSYRAQKAGYEVYFEPKSVVTHEHEAGAIKTNIKQSRVTKIAYRNQFFFVWLNITDPSYIASHIFWLPYHLLKAVFRKDIEFLLGFFNALVKLPKVMFYRKNMIQLFNKTDKAIIESAK